MTFPLSVARFMSLFLKLRDSIFHLFFQNIEKLVTKSVGTLTKHVRYPMSLYHEQLLLVRRVLLW